MKLLMENWRKYLKDHNLDKLPLGAAPGSYKFESPEEMEEYTRWRNPGKLHKLNVTWEDLLHALFIGGRSLADYADESAEDREARRAKEAEGIPVAMTPEKQQEAFDKEVLGGADPTDPDFRARYPDVETLGTDAADFYFKSKYDWLEETKIKK